MQRQSTHKITTVVFDLDDTLYDCYRQRVLAAHRYACRALLAAGLRGRGSREPSLHSLYRLRLKLFRAEPDLDTLDYRLCVALGADERSARRLARAGHRAYFSSPVGQLKLFRDTLPTLRRLHAAGVRSFILTAGRRSIQRAKIRRLGLDRSPFVQGVFYTGLMRGRGKKHYLSRLLRAEPNPKRILVAGDRPDSEIRAARELGLWAVRRQGGEFAARQPRRRLERAHHTVGRISEIFALPFEFSGEPSSRR